jgi:isopentenyl phosphate kinase
MQWDLAPLRAALDAGLIPLVNGDTIFDQERGGTILSTEDLFIYLARHLQPGRILLAGIENGVWSDFPARSSLIDEITPQNFPSFAAQIGASASVDVTGGMVDKVRAMLELSRELPGFSALIFSGAQPDVMKQALLGDSPGTRIYQPAQPIGGFDPSDG